MAANRTDRFLEELWQFIQDDKIYRNQTMLFITVDHGRGEEPEETWQHHASRSAMAGNMEYLARYKGGIVGPEAVWMAAIGSAQAAELYGLKTVFANIEDNPRNMTRFFVIASTPAKRTGQDKTALMFTTTHKSGALVDVLNVFARYGINLTNIDTRPSQRRNWEYYFFIDAEGHREDENFVKALAEADEHCGDMQVLGSFPRAIEPV